MPSRERDTDERKEQRKEIGLIEPRLPDYTETSSPPRQPKSPSPDRAPDRPSDPKAPDPHG
jgi:hypothetical protein